MKDIGLTKFGSPDNFVDLRNVVKSHTKKDSWWVEELAKMTNMMLGKIRRLMDHLIRA